MSDSLGNIVIVDRNDGSPVGALPLRDFKVRVSNDRTDRMYLATESGLVISIRDKNREFPIYHKYPERRPILPLFGDDAAEVPADTPPADPAEAEAAEAE